jgi:hypothetical protein
MQNDKSNPSHSSFVPGVDQITAMLEQEEAEQDARMQGSSPKSAEPTAFNASMQEKSSVDKKSREASSEERPVEPDGRYLFDLPGRYFPTGRYFSTDTHETGDCAKKVLADLQRTQKSRVQSPSLLIDDLKELGMYGELSDDNCYINMPFEDVHRLVMTMRMAELILNDRVQSNRKDKMAQIKAQLC